MGSTPVSFWENKSSLSFLYEVYTFLYSEGIALNLEREKFNRADWGRGRRGGREERWKRDEGGEKKGKGGNKNCFSKLIGAWICQFCNLDVFLFTWTST